MTVTVHSCAGTVSGRLDSWDERGCVVDGERIEGPVCIDARRCPRFLPALSGDWPWCQKCGKRKYQHEENAA